MPFIPKDYNVTLKLLSSSPTEQDMKPCIIVHGGASNIADIFVERYKSGTKNAARSGYDVLTKVI